MGRKNPAAISPKARERPTQISELAAELLARHEAGEPNVISPKKADPKGKHRGVTWKPAETSICMKSALYYKPELRGPYHRGENMRAVRQAAYILITRECK